MLKRTLRKLLEMYKNKERFFTDSSQGWNSMKILVYKNKYEIMSTPSWSSVGAQQAMQIPRTGNIQFTSSL